MPTSASLPPEFAALSGQVNYVQRKNDNEYSSSCPRCGGDIHPDGTLPDRFVMWRVNRNGEPFGMCLRGHCNYHWSTKKKDADWTAEERADFRAKAAEVDAAFAAETEERLSALIKTIAEQGLADRYCQDGQAVAECQEYWENRGIPVEWQVYLKKGMLENYTVTGSLSNYVDTAYTNPVWGETGNIENIKLRMAHPKSGNDRFRNLYKSGCQHLYNPLHTELGKLNSCVWVEGENKADVVRIRGGLTNKIRVYGAQSMRPEKRLIAKLADYEVVYLAFDPEAYRRSEYIDRITGEIKPGTIAVMDTAREIGYERARLVIPPRGRKFDDAILEGYNFANALNMAIRPERLLA